MIYAVITGKDIRGEIQTYITKPYVTDGDMADAILEFETKNGGVLTDLRTTVLEARRLRLHSLSVFTEVTIRFASGKSLRASKERFPNVKVGDQLAITWHEIGTVTETVEAVEQSVQQSVLAATP